MKMSQLDHRIQVNLFQIINDVSDGMVLKSSLNERGIVIRGEIGVGNFSVSNAASKKNCLIMAV
jgi:hypothetical protein